MSEPSTSSSVKAKRPIRKWAAWIAYVVILCAIARFALVPVVTRHSVRKAAFARQAFKERRLDDARATILDWLKADPKSGEAYYLLARVDLATDHPQQAFDELVKSLDLGYPVEKLAPYRAVIRAKAGQYVEAEPALRKALDESDEPMPEVAEALARVYLATFRLPRAEAPIARWMKDAPDDPTPYLWQNEIESRRDAGHAVVIQNYQEALRRDPKLAKARLGLADRLRQAHRLDEAAAEFATYIEAHPDDPEGHLGAGRVALEEGLADRAGKSFDRVLELNPTEPTALKERGAIERTRGHLEAARGFLERAIKVDPYDPDSHFVLGQVLQRLGDPDGARREDALSSKLRAEHARLADLRSALVKKPKDLAKRVEVAQWLLEHGHDEEGLTWTEQILHDVPNHEPTTRLLIDYFTRKKDAGKANYYRMMLRKSETPGRSS
jgi:tetratricopeptide (TPR) repeat protein